MTNRSNKKWGVRGLVCLALVVCCAVIFTIFPTTQAWFNIGQKSDILEFKSGKLHYTLEYTPMPEISTPGNPGVPQIIVPGQNLFTTLKLTNYSTIDSELRLKITYTDYANEADTAGFEAVHGDEKTTVDPILPTSKLDVLFASETVNGEKKEYYVYNKTSKFWVWQNAKAADINAQKSVLVKNLPENGITGSYPVPVFEGMPKIPAVPGTPGTPEIEADPYKIKQFCYSGARAGNEFNGVGTTVGTPPNAVTTYVAKPVTITILFQMKQAQEAVWETAFAAKIINGTP